MSATIALYGATGFTGQQLAAWFAKFGGEHEIVLVGRRDAPLKQLAEQHGFTYRLADSTDRSSVFAALDGVYVVLSTAGPFSRYGDPVVDAAVHHGAHYADITGETPWVAEVIARHHDRAFDKDLKIVPMCGFDSIPSDIAAWMMVQGIRAQFGQGTRTVRAAVLAKGGFNGGTFASALAMADDNRAGDPFLLNPAHRRPAVTRVDRDLTSAMWEPILQRWIGPWIMGPVNSRVVRRSAALFADEGQAFGDDFHYQEVADHGGKGQGFKAWRRTAMMFGAALAIRQKALHPMLRSRGPAPGEGPSPELQAKSFFRYRLAAQADDGAILRGTVSAQLDPSNAATIRMLGTCGLMLAEGAGPERSGVLTPAFAFGGELIERLAPQGIAFDID